MSAHNLRFIQFRNNVARPGEPGWCRVIVKHGATRDVIACQVSNSLEVTA